jgi:hypothetical protein
MVSGQISPDWTCLQANDMSNFFQHRQFDLFVLAP